MFFSFSYCALNYWTIEWKIAGSHDVNSMRDMRDALGALGPVDGQNPELNNLTCSMTVVEEGDIVFLTSDGVSDNFDPVVGKFVVARKPDKIIPLVNGAKQTASKPPNRSTITFSLLFICITMIYWNLYLNNRFTYSGSIPTSRTNFTTNGGHSA